jgi:hypothetical protein
VTSTPTATLGPLAESIYATPGTTSVTLNGSDRSASYAFSVDANDPTGTGSGWKLQITSTTFKATVNGTPRSLPTNASSVTDANASCKHGSCVDPTPTALSYPLAIPAGSTPPPATTFYNAAASTGEGEFIVAPSVQVNVPANSYAGAYASTLTLSIVSGP